MDKEMLKKHHFWVLLGVFLLPALAVTAFLFTSVSAATSESLAKIDKHGKDLEASAKSALSKSLESGLNDQKKVLVDHRMDMWQEAWKIQAPIYTWPQNLDTNVLRTLENLPFGGEIASSDQRSFMRNSNTYLKEYEDFTDEKKHVVQFNGGWRNVLTYVPDWDTKPVPQSEELWLAYEDLWVQRELVRIVHTVNQSVAAFKEVSKEEFPETSPRHKKFRNRFWEVELKVVEKLDGKGDVLEGTIKNISNRLQVFGRKYELHLNVWLNKDDEFPFDFVIEGDYLKAGEPNPQPIKSLPKHRLPRAATELAKVEQVFDTLTVPVWRIDRVALGYPSNRTNPLVPKPSTFSKKIIEELQANAAVAPGGSPGGSPGGPGELSSEGSSSGFGRGGGGAAANPTERTPAGLVRNRYAAVTNQVRRMQVGMVLILDQDFLPDVLEALANSKLRCQNTQYHWKRFRSGRGPNPSSGSTPGTRGGPGGVNPEGGEYSPGTPMGFTPGGFGSGFGPGFGSGFSGNVAQNTEGLSVSMIELSVYGIASLYEKFVPEGENKESETESKN